MADARRLFKPHSSAPEHLANCKRRWKWTESVEVSPNLTSTDKLILRLIARHANETTGICCPSQGKLAALAGKGTRTVQYAVSRAIKFGFLVVRKRDYADSNDYYLTFPEAACADGAPPSFAQGVAPLSRNELRIEQDREQDLRGSLPRTPSVVSTTWSEQEAAESTPLAFSPARVTAPEDEEWDQEADYNPLDCPEIDDGIDDSIPEPTSEGIEEAAAWRRILTDERLSSDIDASQPSEEGPDYEFQWEDDPATVFCAVVDWQPGPDHVWNAAKSTQKRAGEHSDDALAHTAGTGHNRSSASSSGPDDGRAVRVRS